MFLVVGIVLVSMWSCVLYGSDPPSDCSIDVYTDSSCTQLLTTITRTINECTVNPTWSNCYYDAECKCSSNEPEEMRYKMYTRDDCSGSDTDGETVLPVDECVFVGFIGSDCTHQTNGGYAHFTSNYANDCCDC